MEGLYARQLVLTFHVLNVSFPRLTCFFLCVRKFVTGGDRQSELGEFEPLENLVLNADVKSTDNVLSSCPGNRRCSPGQC